MLVWMATTAGAWLLVAERSFGLLWIDEAARSTAVWHVHPGLNRLMAGLTSLGEDLLILTAFGAVALRSHRARGAPWGRFFLLVMAGALVLDNAVKPLVGRTRPPFEQLVGGKGASFPSGHAVAATALLFALAVYLSSGRRVRVRTIFWAVALAGSLLMGVSRVYLGVHWPTDAIAGIALGATWTLMCVRSQGVTASPSYCSDAGSGSSSSGGPRSSSTAAEKRGSSGDSSVSRRDRISGVG